MYIIGMTMMRCSEPEKKINSAWNEYVDKIQYLIHPLIMHTRIYMYDLIQYHMINSNHIILLTFITMMQYHGIKWYVIQKQSYLSSKLKLSRSRFSLFSATFMIEISRHVYKDTSILRLRKITFPNQGHFFVFL